MNLRLSGGPRGLHLDMELLIEQPAEKYHEQSREFFTSHQLLDFKSCPQFYDKKRRGLIEDAESTALRVGRAAHVRILEGKEAFENQFVVGSPINPSTGKPYGTDTQAFKKWADQQSKPVLSPEHADQIQRMATGVGANTQIVGLLSDGRPEAVARVVYRDIQCQARFDWIHPRRGIVDLKTCDDIARFEYSARSFGYPSQLAFYRSVLALLMEVDPCEVPVHLVAIEKKEPFRAGIWRMSEEVLGLAQKDNEADMDRLKNCRKTGIWPTGYEEPRIFDRL